MSSIRSLIKKADFRKAAPAILLVFNSFVWYILTYPVFADAVNGLDLARIENFELFGCYFASLAVTAVIGSVYLPRARIKSLYFWPFLGVIATLLLGALSGQSLLINVLITIFFGASVGIGLPSCLSYFAESTSIETRGLSAGLTWSSVGIAVLILAFLITPLGLWETFVVLAIWRLLGGISFVGLDRKYEKPQPAQKSPSYSEVIRKREVLLYLFPWTMFSLINFIEAPILENVFGAATFSFILLVEFALVGLFAVVGGILADIHGRKRVTIAGFVMLGIEYAALSLFYSSPLMLYLYLILDGATWGLLLSIFFTVIWGDIGGNQVKEKYFTLGGLPYLLSNYLSIIIQPYVKFISAALAFSFASFFLFMSVIPLMYAPETLPEKSMKDRELKSYIEKAQELVQKETGKNKSQGTEKTKKEDAEAKEETRESVGDEEARKLAEKYY